MAAAILRRLCSCDLEAQPGVEPGYETVPHLRVAIPPPGRTASLARGGRFCSKKPASRLAHVPEKWAPAFRKRTCANARRLQGGAASPRKLKSSPVHRCCTISSNSKCAPCSTAPISTRSKGRQRCWAPPARAAGRAAFRSPPSSSGVRSRDPARTLGRPCESRDPYTVPSRISCGVWVPALRPGRQRVFGSSATSLSPSNRSPKSADRSSPRRSSPRP